MSDRDHTLAEGDAALTGGRWITGRGGIQRWQPDGSETPIGRRRFRALLSERYADSAWWRSHIWDDSPHVTAQRRADMEADFMGLDGRSREIKRGAA
jgi:hypothetical protein